MMTTTATISRPQPRPRPDTGQEREITSRPRKVAGQLGGVHATATAINGADTDQQVDEPATAVRRHVRGRGGRR